MEESLKAHLNDVEAEFVRNKFGVDLGFKRVASKPNNKEDDFGLSIVEECRSEQNADEESRGMENNSSSIEREVVEETMMTRSDKSQ